MKELRLAGINTLPDANYMLKAYLPVFNKKFEVLARSSGDFHRQLDKRINIDDVLSVQTKGFLRNDRTLLHDKQWYQVLTKTRAQWITVYEYLNGQKDIRYGKTRLGFKTIEPPAPKVYQPVVSRFKVRGISIPAKNHVWRRAYKVKQKADISNLVESGHF